VTALRRLLGGLAEEPGLARTAGLLAKAAISAPVTGRPLYAGLRALPLPADPAGLLWHAANLLREHRGDGHVAALVCSPLHRNLHRSSGRCADRNATQCWPTEPIRASASWPWPRLPRTSRSALAEASSRT
jgi:hypothetical protein